MTWKWEMDIVPLEPVIQESEWTWIQGASRIVDGISDCEYLLHPDGTVTDWHSPIRSETLDDLAS